MVKTTNQLSMLIFFQPPAVLAMQVTGHYQSVTKSVAPGAATLAAAPVPAPRQARMGTTWGPLP